MSRRLALCLIVLASLLAHAKGLLAPPLDYHYHRQVNVAAIARNYHENGLKFMEPQIDWDGPSRGRAATEFPLYIWLIGLLWPLAGLGEVWGRLLSTGFSAATAVYLFKFVEKDAGTRPAFWAALLFSFIPLEIYFGRTLQPEAAALLGATAALFHFRRSLSAQARPWDWPLAVLSAFLAISMKLPYGVILIPLAYLAWQQQGLKAFTNLKVVAAPLLALGGVYAWYRYAAGGTYVVPTRASEFTNILDYQRLPYFILFQFTSRLPELALTYSGAVLATIGLMPLLKKNPFYAVWWLAVALSLICGGGYTFHHEYTSLPLVPVNAAFMGLGAAQLLEKRYRLLAAIIILVMPFNAAFRIKHWYKQNYPVLATAAQAASAVSAPEDLFIANERAASVYLFYLQRRGWSWDIEESGESRLPDVAVHIALGAKFFATGKAGVFADKASVYAKWFSRFPVVYDQGGLLIYDLRQATTSRKEDKKMFTMTSPAFKQGETIPKAHTCEGKDPSPELSWSGAPAKTKSFALIMNDPDAPVGLWVHWVLYDIPGNLAGLPGDLPKTERVLDGAKHGASWGVDSFSRVGYGGPCPPPGKPHRYFFKLYALDKVLGLPPRATSAELGKAMEGHILGRTELMGLFQR